ncbi:MAG: alpha/beta hydrolase, partial [Cellulomonadaceae bacterium]|nr:alpha/beta hydrolase [Cellulomonadaceae bacterium]
RDVTYVPEPGGIHDLSLSAARPRETYLRTMLSWVDAQVPVRR